MANTWIVVADAARARIFEAASPGSTDWTLVGEYDHPESRLTAHDIATDAEGKPLQMRATGYRAAMRGGTPTREVEAQKFGRFICEMLEAGLEAHAFSQLVLVAPPSFLGVLRNELTPELEKAVVDSIAKDYTALRPEDVASRL